MYMYIQDPFLLNSYLIFLDVHLQRKWSDLNEIRINVVAFRVIKFFDFQGNQCVVI